MADCKFSSLFRMTGVVSLWCLTVWLLINLGFAVSMYCTNMNVFQVRMAGNLVILLFTNFLQLERKTIRSKRVSLAGKCRGHETFSL